MTSGRQRIEAAKAIFSALPEVQVCEMEPADANAAIAFFGSMSGQTLLNRLRLETLNLFHAAVFSKGDAFECGKAAGYKWLLSHLETFTLSAHTEDSPASTDQLPPELEHLANT